MAAGTTYKQCGCRDDDGRRLGQRCPRLHRRDGGWSSDHGRWYYQLELPARANGTRRPVRRGGFSSRDAARAELDRARELLAIAPAAEAVSAAKGHVGGDSPAGLYERLPTLFIGLWQVALAVRVLRTNPETESGPPSVVTPGASQAA